MVNLFVHNDAGKKNKHVHMYMGREAYAHVFEHIYMQVHTLGVHLCC